MKALARFPSDATCPICGTNDQRPCTVLADVCSYEGEGPVRGVAFHVTCVMSLQMHFNQEEGVVYGRIQDKDGTYFPPPEPDYCTSVHCEPPRRRCPECSHAVYEGNAVVGGVTYKWRFPPLFGPGFFVDGVEVFPKAGHDVWRKFNEWHEEVFGKAF